MNFLKRFDEWYDKLNEPWRMIFAMIMISSGGILVQSFRTEHRILGVFGLILFLFTTVWVLYRLFRISKAG